MHRKHTLAALALLASAGSADAFTPESGFWWNPAEGGRGFSIEIQDNFLFAIGYVYSATGVPTWLSAQGTLVVNTTNDTASYVGALDSFSNGQCIGCPYRAPTPQLGSGGTFRIDFTSQVRGRITWSGGTVPIQRFDYALTPPGGDPRTDAMLGQWQVVLDTGTFPYQADVLVFDRLSENSIEKYFDGCRILSSLQRACTSTDRSLRDASGFHAVENGAGNDKDRLLITVRNSSNNFLIYYLDYGTDRFTGVANYCSSSIPAADRRRRCIDTATSFIEARGFRTRSRSYVAGNNNAPHAAEPTPKALQAIGLEPNPPGSGMSKAEVLERTGLDLDAIPAEAFDALMERMDRAPR